MDETQRTNGSAGSAFKRVKEEIRELPPSAKLVALVLSQEGPLRQSELVDETLLPERTVRYGLEELNAAGILRTDPDLMDARRQVYSLRPAEDRDYDESPGLV